MSLLLLLTSLPHLPILLTARLHALIAAAHLLLLLGGRLQLLEGCGLGEERHLHVAPLGGAMALLLGGLGAGTVWFLGHVEELLIRHIAEQVLSCQRIRVESLRHAHGINLLLEEPIILWIHTCSPWCTTHLPEVVVGHIGWWYLTKLTWQLLLGIVVRVHLREH